MTEYNRKYKGVMLPYIRTHWYATVQYYQVM